MSDATCSHEGCARPVYARTWCKHHYDARRRDAATWTTVLTRGNDEQRFWSKVNKTDSCWFWTASLNRTGYGRFSAQGFEFAHRFSYELAYGPIPEGLVIDHLCRNPSCVRPSHLEAVTHRTNIIRGTAPTARNHFATNCIHGHEFTPENTYIRPNGNRACRTCLKALRAGYRRKRGIKPKIPLLALICPVCGTEFKPAARHVVCCSRSCGQQLRFHGNATRRVS